MIEVSTPTDAVGIIRWDVPIDIGRDGARELAERELIDPVYASAEPPWWQRASSWAWEQLTELLGFLGGAADNALWLIVVGVLIALIAFAVMRRTGGVQRRRGSAVEVFADRTLSAPEHRRLAEDAARDGDWAAAVREGFRAIVRQLEERGAIDPHPGRTADEAVRDAGKVFAALRDDLEAAARHFDEVAYGDRPGTSQAYAQISTLDRALSHSAMVGA